MSRASDQQLVARCIAGDQEAWRTLTAEFRESVRGCHANYSSRWKLKPGELDEVANRVWITLWENDCRHLRRYDPEKSSLATFISLVARDQFRRLWRSDRRRRARERVAARNRVFHSTDLSTQLLCDPRFLRTLSPAERKFLEHLLSRESPAGYSKSNAWQLRHRLKSRLQQFISL